MPAPILSVLPMRQCATRQEASPETKATAKKSVAEIAQANPYRFFTFGEISELFGFGADLITKVVEMGAPVVARKINPTLLLEWLKSNAAAVGKIRD